VSNRTAAGALALLWLACSSEPALDLGPDEALVPVQRLVDAEVGHDGPLSLDLPLATIRDDSRYVLRAPRQHTLLWPKFPDDRSGNRLLRRVQALPAELRGARRLLVQPIVKIGSELFEPPPQVRPVRPGQAGPSVALVVPIPANPLDRKLVVQARAIGLGLVDLGSIDTPTVEIPAEAWLGFAVGVVEPDWGFDPVEFRVSACEEAHCEEVFRSAYDPRGGSEGHWQDHRVSLASHAGTRRSFRFEARRQGEESPFALPVWANPTLYTRGAREAGQRNVILLSIDTLRADHLTSYGYRHDTAPFVEERFGQSGTVFESPVAAATITTPSHASMFTSLTPPAHGTLDGLKRLPKTLPTLAELLRHAGRDTAAITENGWLSIGHGFGRGFDSFVENRSPNIMDPTGQVDRTFAQARAWLAHNRHKRFFLFLHTFQVHTPYAPPARYEHLFADVDGTPIDGESPSHLRWMAEYDREIRYVDDELRRLFETLDALGLADDTVFILTSDHGEAFLEHGLLEHGSRLDEEVVRVPLMLWGSGIPAGRRVTAPVAHVDLMPTVLEMMGVPVPGWLEGWSLLPLASGSAEEEARFASRPVYSESRGTVSLGPDRSFVPFHPPATLVRLGDRKLARYRQGDVHRYEYYDLSSDPMEQRDLYATRASEAGDLFRLLEGYEERGRALRARIDRGQTDGQDVDLDPRQEEKLRALGYLR